IIYEQAVTVAHTHLGEQAFNAARDQGRTMTLPRGLTAPSRTVAASQTAAGHLSATTIKHSPGYPSGLTTREVEVLRLVAQGLTDAQVAEQLSSQRHLSLDASTESSDLKP
ncbi:MAG TPA: LuxR C-terminal-related transcriptional regulator, partial [Ktedonobacteraceae bacterium]